MSASNDLRRTGRVSPDGAAHRLSDPGSRDRDDSTMAASSFKFGSDAGSHASKPVGPRTVPSPRAEIRCPRGHVIGVADNKFFYFGGDPIPLTASDSFEAWCGRCKRRLDPMWRVQVPALKKLLNKREAAGVRRPVKIKIAEVGKPRQF